MTIDKPSKLLVMCERWRAIDHGYSLRSTDCNKITRSLNVFGNSAPKLNGSVHWILLKISYLQ